MVERIGHYYCHGCDTWHELHKYDSKILCSCGYESETAYVVNANNNAPKIKIGGELTFCGDCGKATKVVGEYYICECGWKQKRN